MCSSIDDATSRDKVICAQRKGIRDGGGMKQTCDRLKQEGRIVVEDTGRDVRIRLGGCRCLGEIGA